MPVDPEIQSRLDFAVKIARDVSPFILEYFQNPDLVVESKEDATPVTVADKGAEEKLRDLIHTVFSEDGVLGEEFEEVPSKNGYRWILDPIDGTKSFVQGVPLFGTLIGIEHEGQALAGVSRFPALDEVVYAAKGGGAYWQIRNREPRRARVNDVPKLEQGVFCTTTMRRWASMGRQPTFEELCRRAKLTRGWGDCYGHCLVATGRTQLMIDPAMSAWDAAPLLPIVEEAGGHFVTWKGEATIYGGDGISVVPGLKDDVLRMLAE
ncbi:inositol monophosphatase family protein [Stratiformator vulcanicus]|uniref:Histidinol-phosphatase n=1 Tax=Stratiformator vulcanicus TaxID=2527980 RepID=A0A517R2G3_9PLAN|nr:inositol monophosphatase family protein [Stratiformator vulcanicus]QDT38069.1 Histidinol-phosphatase [Stratiformator vulcanicus]